MSQVRFITREKINNTPVFEKLIGKYEIVSRSATYESRLRFLGKQYNNVTVHETVFLGYPMKNIEGVELFDNEFIEELID